MKGGGQAPQQYGGALNGMRGQAMQQRQMAQPQASGGVADRFRSMAAQQRQMAQPQMMAQPQAKPQMAEVLRNFRGRIM